LATTKEDWATSVSLLLQTFAETKNRKMKITVTGSLGHIGKPLTKELVQKGHAVTVISSKPEKRKDIEALGATTAIGTLEDADFLAATFIGADAVYTMIPPIDFLNPDLDLMAYCRRIGNNFAQAIRQSGVKRVVHLSSIGAHLDKGSGLILFHHEVEGILNNLSNVAITHMRPAAFYYNLYSFVPVIKNTGVIASNYGAEDKVVWVSPIDIAAAIADEIVTPLVGSKVRYVASDELAGDQVASTLGAAIGKPELKWILITDEQMRSGLAAFGMPAQIAAGFVEMNASMHSGELFQDYYLNRPRVMGKVKLTDFAKEFAATFKQK
jgi:uncharacterized protein YbjT (DUF2867 family)